jgi:myb proto-oncogene protein
MAASSSFEIAESFSPDSHELFQIDDSFWSETLAMTVDSNGSMMEAGDPLVADGASMPSSNADMDFWVTLFMQAGDMQNLPQI